MFEHIDNKKEALVKQKMLAKSTGKAKKGETFSVIPQYIVDKEQTPIQRKLDDKDISAITNSKIDSCFSIEFSRIYEQNKDHINYGESKKQGEAFIKDGHLGATIEDKRGFWKKYIFEDRLAEILRQSAILHEVTHLAVMDYNIRRDQMGIPGTITKDELIQISSSEMEEKKIQDEVYGLFEVVEEEKELLQSCGYAFSGTAKNLYEYLCERIGYIMMSGILRVEYPAVINELNYLFSCLEPKFSGCKTAGLLRKLATDSFILRN